MKQTRRFLALLLVVCMMLSIIPAASAVAPKNMTITKLASASEAVAETLQAAIRAGTNNDGVYSNVVVPSEIVVDRYTMGVEDYILLAARAINDLGAGMPGDTAIVYKEITLNSDVAQGVNLTSVSKGMILDLARRVEMYGISAAKLPTSFNRPSDGSSTYEGRICIYSIGSIFAQTLASYAADGKLPADLTFIPTSYTTTATSAPQVPEGNGLLVSDESAAVIEAAIALVEYVDQKETLPTSITIGSTTYGPSDFSHLIAQVIVNINNGNNYAPLEIIDIAEPANPNETSVATTITKTEYLDLANRTIKWNRENPAGANYMNSSIGHIHHHEAIYLYCSILAYYAENLSLPDSAKIYTWAKLTGFTAGNATFGADFSAYAKYLVPTANCQSNNATLISVAKTGMVYGGTPSNTYQAMYNLMEYLNDKTYYTEYYDTSRGATGTWRDKTGNCCDMAHLMIACARSLGVPGRYRHGYCHFTSGLKTGHVWADVFCGTAYASKDRYNSDGWLTADLVSDYNYLGYKTNTTSYFKSADKVAELPF